MQTSAHSRVKHSIYTAMAVAAISFASMAPASAGADVDISGDSNFKITTEAETSHNKVKRSKRVTGKVTISYKARVLGIPLPVTGFFINSFPTIFKQPRVDSYSGQLSSTTYRKVYDSWQRKTQWLVKGQEDFWGEKVVKVTGSAVGNTKGSGFFHGGTGTGHDIDANVSLRVTLT